MTFMIIGISYPEDPTSIKYLGSAESKEQAELKIKMLDLSERIQYTTFENQVKNLILSKIDMVKTDEALKRNGYGKTTFFSLLIGIERKIITKEILGQKVPEFVPPLGYNMKKNIR